jgi:hypothetical protein
MALNNPDFIRVKHNKIQISQLFNGDKPILKKIKKSVT